MPDDSITVETSPRDLLQRMEKYPKELDKRMMSSLLKALYAIQGEAPSYPAPSRKPFKFKSEKQRRYVMALIGEGKVPYKRRAAGGLGGSLRVGAGSSITERKSLGGGHYMAALGSRLDYAKWVIGTDQQAQYHRGTWWTVKEWADRARPKVVKVFEALTNELAAFLDGKG